MKAFVIQDLHGDSKSYLRTLNEWNTNFAFGQKGKIKLGGKGTHNQCFELKCTRICHMVICYTFIGCLVIFKTVPSDLIK